MEIGDSDMANQGDSVVLLISGAGVGPGVSNTSNVKCLKALSPPGPGPPVTAPVSARSSHSNVAMETMVNTIISRDSFSESYIGAMRKDIKAMEDNALISKSNQIQKQQRSVKQKRRLGNTVRTSRPDQSGTTSGSMADMTSAPPDGGPLAVTAEDGSIKKFTILPPIEGADQAAPHGQNAQEQERPQKENDSRDLDYNDPSTYGWHISSVEKWPANEDGSKDYKSHSGDRLGPIANTKLHLRPSLPNSTSYGTGKSGQEQQISGTFLTDAGSLSNPYVAMSVMTSGQEELKKHLKHRQQQRASDQKDFKTEAVNGKPLNSTGTYLIKYGNVEVPTTDVELYAILSVEKHNSPFANEFDLPSATNENLAIPEKMEEKLSSLVEKDRMETQNLAIPEKMEEKLASLVEKDRKETQNLAIPGKMEKLANLVEKDRKETQVPNYVLNEREYLKQREEQEPQSDGSLDTKAHAESPDRPDPNFPLVHTSKPLTKGVPKLGHLIVADTRAKRRLKQGQLYKCYDTKPAVRVKPTMEAIALKPLVSTAPVEVVTRVLKGSESELQPEELTELNEDESKVGRRNIRVTLPTVTCDYEEDTSQTTSLQDEGSIRDELSPHPNKTPAPIPTNRQPYRPPKVNLGNTTHAIPISEIPSSARSSASSSSSRTRSARQSHDDDNRREAKPPDAVDMEMKEKMLTVMGANFTGRNPSSANSTHPRSARSNEGGGTASPEHSRRMAPPARISARKQTFSDDKYESMSVSMISVSSDPIDSRSSSAHLRVTPGAEGMLHTGITAHAITSERMSSSRGRSNSSLTASRGLNTGSLPELHPPVGLAPSPVTGLQVVPVVSATGVHRPNIGLQNQTVEVGVSVVKAPPALISTRSSLRSARLQKL